LRESRVTVDDDLQGAAGFVVRQRPGQVLGAQGAAFAGVAPVESLLLGEAGAGRLRGGALLGRNQGPDVKVFADSGG